MPGVLGLPQMTVKPHDEVGVILFGTTGELYCSAEIPLLLACVETTYGLGRYPKPPDRKQRG